PLGLTASDIYLHDTFYVIGHFHYVVAPGTLFALFAGIYYWYPKATGRQMNATLGKLHFWFSFVAINFIFMPMFFQGMAGLSRRLYVPTVYAHGRGVQALNVVVSCGAWGLGLAQIFFIINFFISLKGSHKVAGHLWHGSPLEGAGPCPPPRGG